MIESDNRHSYMHSGLSSAFLAGLITYVRVILLRIGIALDFIRAIDCFYIWTCKNSSTLPNEKHNQITYSFRKQTIQQCSTVSHTIAA